MAPPTTTSTAGSTPASGPPPAASEASLESLPYSTDEPSRPWSEVLVDGAVVLGGLAFTLLVATTTITDARLGPRVVVLVAGALVLLGLITLALTRFEEFLVVLFVMRTALDYFKPAEGGGVLEPPTLIGALTLVVSASWLWHRRQQGLLVGISRVSLALIGLSALTFVNPLFALDKMATLQSAIRILSFTVLYIVLEQLFRRDPSRRRPLLKAMLLSLVIPAFVALLQLTRDQGTAEWIDVGRVRGTFFHPNPFGTYLVMVVVVGYVLATTARTPLGRLPFFFAGAAGATLLIFTYARAAWLALILGIVVLGARVDRRILGALAAGAVVILVAVPSVATRLADLDDQQEVNAGDPNSLAWRVGYWEEILPYGLSSPVGGIGLESTGSVTDAGLEPHNVFVQAFVELGLPGLVAVLALILAIINEIHRAHYWARDRWEEVLSAGATAIGVGFFIQLFSENLLTQPVTLWYFGLVLAAALANGWQDGVSPTTILGALSDRQRISMLRERRRQPQAGVIERSADGAAPRASGPFKRIPSAVQDSRSDGSSEL